MLSCLEIILKNRGNFIMTPPVEIGPYVNVQSYDNISKCLKGGHTFHANWYSFFKLWEIWFP